MKIFTTIIITILFGTMLSAQDNCNVFLWEGDSCKYKACKYLQEAPSYFQLRREYHQIYDEAIKICPEYSTSYRNKSTAYLKTGDFITWKKLMDKAVELDPKQHLGYRGWGRFQFFRDYEGAIEDFDQLASLVGYKLGYSENGNYRLNIARGLCYKMLGETKKALRIVEYQIGIDTVTTGLFDYLHLGVLYLEDHAYQKALKAFEKQSQINELAESYYYRALALKELQQPEQSLVSLKNARELYLNGRCLYDDYTHQIDKVFLKQIEAELERMTTVSN